MNFSYFINILIIIQIYLINLSKSQISQTSLSAIQFVSPTTCNDTHYFDISHLQCKLCPGSPNSVSYDSKHLF